MRAQPLQLGPVRLETNLLLAPIAGWCDLAWRETVRGCGGVGLACTDLLSPQGLIGGGEKSADLARTSDADRPIGMQLYGSDPGVMAEGARWCAAHGATVVDINMGCPVDKVTKKDGGSRLMCDLGRAEAIAGAVRAALPEGVPLTCKMRLGWDGGASEAGCAAELAVRLVRVGVAGITVHGRTTEQRFKGEVRREGIRRVVEAVAAETGPAAEGGVPVIGNGDVRTAEDALAMLAETGCAGVMIGRGAFARPFVFREAWAAQRGEACAEPSDEETVGVVRAYFERLRAYKDDARAMHVIRQKISWLGRSISGGHCRALKDAVRLASDPGAVHAALDGWLDGSLPRGGEGWPGEAVGAVTTG